MALPEKKLEMVHLQLTRKCNLRCYFCGQWGRKGFFSGGADTDMRFEEWHRVIDRLIEYRKTSGISPEITLWGGEPLVYPEFKAIVEYLRANEFQLKLITNGVLLDRFAISHIFHVVRLNVHSCYNRWNHRFRLWCWRRALAANEQRC